MISSSSWNYLSVWKQMINSINYVQKMVNIKLDMNTW